MRVGRGGSGGRRSLLPPGKECPASRNSERKGHLWPWSRYFWTQVRRPIWVPFLKVRMMDVLGRASALGPAIRTTRPWGAGSDGPGCPGPSQLLPKVIEGAGQVVLARDASMSCRIDRAGCPALAGNCTLQAEGRLSCPERPLEAFQRRVGCPARRPGRARIARSRAGCPALGRPTSLCSLGIGASPAADPWVSCTQGEAALR